jgi:hypothetical protein
VELNSDIHALILTKDETGGLLLDVELSAVIVEKSMVGGVTGVSDSTALRRDVRAEIESCIETFADCKAANCPLEACREMIEADREDTCRAEAVNSCCSFQTDAERVL